MLSKLLRSKCIPALLLPRVKVMPRTVRSAGDLVPPTQYDVPFPKKLNMLYAMKVYWETIPLFVVTWTSLFILSFAIVWACRNKVDIVFTTHSRDNISRTMNLRDPSVHKMVIINQRYEPWPEMQDALDKMVMAEKRALVRMQSCTHA